MIDDHRRLIFVHIQKTGGDAITAALGDASNRPEKHRSASELIDVYGRERWATYFKFAFVRNPWDRLVSWWSMIDAHRAAFEQGAPLNSFQRFVLSRARTFDEFLHNCDEEMLDHDGTKWIYRNQVDYLNGEQGLLVDFVGRFERLNEDFDIAMARSHGARIALPHLNKSHHRHYSSYYSDETEQMVAERYQRDIDMFSYRFERER